jgi:hypothetical protein
MVDAPANSVGDHNTILIPDDGVPVISYIDDTDDDLKVAK